MTSPTHAWGDESARLGLPAPVYLLGVVIADGAACDEARDTMLSLVRSGRRLHYREMDANSRARALAAIGELGLDQIIVVASPVTPKGQERARALCLEHLAWVLHESGVASLTLEARPASLMQRDRSTIDSLRGKQALPRGLRVAHALPSNEPMLWIADQVLGAFGDSLTGDSDLFELVKSRTSVETIQQR